MVGIVWIVFAVLGVQVAPNAPIASTSAAALGWDRLRQVHTDLRDQQQFARRAAVRPRRATTPTDRLLTGLRGKDVIVAFVESYGRSAVQGSTLRAAVSTACSRPGRLSCTRPASTPAAPSSPRRRSAGISWLAHSTLQSGLWIDNQLRYDQLVAGNRYTLSDAFRRAGWHTAVDVPSEHAALAAGAARSTTTTTCSTRTTSATAARSSATPRCPTSTRWRRSTGASSAPGTPR